MTPFQLRMFVVAFFGVATAISVNALYYQEAPHLAGAALRAPVDEQQQSAVPATAALPKEELLARVPRDGPVAALGEAPLAESPSAPSAAEESDTPPIGAKARTEHPPDAPVPPRRVRAIQRELVHRGYDPGEVNGEVNAETRAAIIAFEFDEGMPLTGTPSEAVLKSLIFGAAMGKPGPGPEDRFERRRTLVRQVQNVLARLGYSAGPVDGQFVPATREAIKKFENDRSLAGNGRLTARVLLEIVIVSGQPFGAAS